MATRRKQSAPPAVPIANRLAERAGEVEIIPGDENWQMAVGEAQDLLEADRRISGAEREDEHAPPEQTSADRVMSMLAGAKDDDRAKVTIHQVLPNAKEAWCEDLSPLDYELGGLKMIREKWGPGNYRIRLYGVNKSGVYGILTSAPVTVKEQRDPMPQMLAAPNGMPSESLRVLMEGQAALLKALTEKPVAQNPMETMREMFVILKLMKEATGETPVAKSTVGELVDAIKELRSASDIISPEGGGDDTSLTGMVKSMLPLISTAIANRTPTPAPAPVPLGPPLSFMSEPAPPEGDEGDELARPAPFGERQSFTQHHQRNPIAQTGDENPMSAEALLAIKLKAYVSTLLLYAVNGQDPQKGAELIYEKLPDEWIDLLELDTWWDLFAGQVPQAIPHRAWFTAARDRAMIMFDADEAEGPATAAGVHEAPGGKPQGGG